MNKIPAMAIMFFITAVMGFMFIMELYLLFFGEEVRPESARVHTYVKRNSHNRKSTYYEVVYTWTDAQGREHQAVEVGLSGSRAKQMADGNPESWPIIHYSKRNPDSAYVSSTYSGLIFMLLSFPFLVGLFVFLLFR